MSPMIMIPDDVSRMEITINEQTYTYKGGDFVNVPYEVAEVINHNQEKPGGARNTLLGNAGVLTPGQAETIGVVYVYTLTDGTLCVPRAPVFYSDHKPLTIAPQGEILGYQFMLWDLHGKGSPKAGDWIIHGGNLYPITGVDEAVTTGPYLEPGEEPPSGPN